MHFHLLIFHLPLDIFKYNRHQRSVAARQARNSTHCFECFPDALKFGPVQLHRRCDATRRKIPFSTVLVVIAFQFRQLKCQVLSPCYPVSAFLSGLTIVEKSLLKAVIRIKQSVRKPGLRSNWFGGGPVFVRGALKWGQWRLSHVDVNWGFLLSLCDCLTWSTAGNKKVDRKYFIQKFKLQEKHAGRNNTLLVPARACWHIKTVY